jgi:tetratricopeptide (TPR) repeat protein
MEIAFQANHRFASFLFDKSALEYARKDFHAAIATLQIALKHIDRSREFGFWSGPLHELHVSVHSLLGQAYEAAGEPKKALEQFDQAVGLSGVGGAHYLAGLMLGTQALNALLVRGSEEDALRLFLEAEQRMHQANPLPQGVTEENRKNYIQFLQGSISMLKGKNVSPSESLNF